MRPGGVSREDLSQVLGFDVLTRDEAAAISAPGQTKSHYAPRASVRLNATDWQEGEARLGFGNVACDLNLSEEGDLREAAANLFEFMHQLDATGSGHIAVSPIPEAGLGLAINDRLARAAADR